MAMEHGNLDQPQRWHRNGGPRSQQGSQMALQTLFDYFQRLLGFLAEARQDVESRLRVEDILLQLLQIKNGDGLLLQFVNSALAPLACGLEDMNHAAPNGPRLRQARKQRRYCNRRRIRNHLKGSA